MHNFVSRELFIAHTLSRHFSWSHNVLFPDTDLPPIQKSGSNSSTGEGKSTPPPTVVVLSGNDAIVPTRETADYLARCAAEMRASSADPNQPINELFEVMCLEGIQHGEMCLHTSHLNMVQARLQERCPPRKRVLESSRTRPSAGLKKVQ